MVRLNKALLIAIAYRGSRLELRGCVNDQERLYAYLKEKSPDCEIRVLCDDDRIKAPVFGRPTRYEILKQIEWLSEGATKDTHVWLSYSGHGGTQKSKSVRVRVLDTKNRRRALQQNAKPLQTALNERKSRQMRALETHVLESTQHRAADAGRARHFSFIQDMWNFNRRRRRRRRRPKTQWVNDEIDNADETIVPVDYKYRGHITDDTLRKILIDRLPKDSFLTAFFDCCHSGTVLDLRYNWLDRNAAGLRPVLDMQTHPNCADSKAHVLMLSGCLDSQTAADAYIDDKFCGATTEAFLHHVELMCCHECDQSEAEHSESFTNESDVSTRSLSDSVECIDTLESLLHSMNVWMRENQFDQRPQISLGRMEHKHDAISKFLPC